MHTGTEMYMYLFERLAFKLPYILIGNRFNKVRHDINESFSNCKTLAYCCTVKQ